MKTKQIILIGFTAVIAFAGCKGPKKIQKVTDAQEITVPFSESKYESDKDFFRAKASGKSPDMEDSRRIAMLNAKRRLAGDIKEVLSSAMRQFTQTLDGDSKQDFEGKFSNQTWTFVDQILIGTKEIGEKLFINTDKSYTAWVVIEVSVKSMVDGVSNEVSQDKKLEISYDQKKFAEDVAKEKERMAKEKKDNAK